MGLNDIQFPATTIAGLYRSSLIDSDEQTVIRENKSPAEKQDNFLGENKKNILIIVDYKEAKYLPDDELSFLTNMLNACKLNLADVAIVNLNARDGVNYKELVAELKSRIVFLFGVEPSFFGLPVSFPHFQIQPFANATFLFTPSLNECNKDALLKSKLWVCLRRIFAI